MLTQIYKNPDVTQMVKEVLPCLDKKEQKKKFLSFPKLKQIPIHQDPVTFQWHLITFRSDANNLTNSTIDL